MMNDTKPPVKCPICEGVVREFVVQSGLVEREVKCPICGKKALLLKDRKVLQEDTYAYTDHRETPDFCQMIRFTLVAPTGMEAWRPKKEAALDD